MQDLCLEWSFWDTDSGVIILKMICPHLVCSVLRAKQGLVYQLGGL